MLPALQELAVMLSFRDSGTGQFTGPVRGADVEPGLLYRACWGLALLTEVYRRVPAIAAAGPVGRLPGKSARALLAAAPDAGFEQLAALRVVMESAFCPPSPPVTGCGQSGRHSRDPPSCAVTRT
jgi:hypothetical protein